MLMAWTGPDRRLTQSAYDGPDRRRAITGNGEYAGSHGPHGGRDPFRAWLAQWVAPQTLIALIAFAGMTSVAHYRLSVVERELAEVRADVLREVASIRAETMSTYQRRDVLVEQLAAINQRLRDIERAVRQ